MISAGCFYGTGKSSYGVGGGTGPGVGNKVEGAFDTAGAGNVVAGAFVTGGGAACVIGARLCGTGTGPLGGNSGFAVTFGSSTPVATALGGGPMA